MKMFETSPLEIPLILLAKLFPSVENHYHGRFRADAYQHVYTGFIASLICILIGFYWGIGIAFILHVIVKELIRDTIVRGYFSKVDIITRVYGFVLAVPFYFLKGVL